MNATGLLRQPASGHAPLLHQSCRAGPVTLSALPASSLRAARSRKGGARNRCCSVADLQSLGSHPLRASCTITTRDGRARSSPVRCARRRVRRCSTCLSTIRSAAANQALDYSTALRPASSSLARYRRLLRTSHSSAGHCLRIRRCARRRAAVGQVWIASRCRCRWYRLSGVVSRSSAWCFPAPEGSRRSPALAMTAVVVPGVFPPHHLSPGRWRSCAMRSRRRTPPEAPRGACLETRYLTRLALAFVGVPWLRLGRARLAGGRYSRATDS